MSIEDEMKASAKVLQEAWPLIQEYCGGGSIQSIEGEESSKFMKNIDVFSGIDAWQTIPESCIIRGIASRAQTGHNWETFTVRRTTGTGSHDTEYKKRMEAVKNRDRLFPYWTVQIYKENDKISAIGVVRTEDLYDYIQNGPRDIEQNNIRGTLVTFFVIRWNHLSAWLGQSNRDIFVWRPEHG